MDITVEIYPERDSHNTYPNAMRFEVNKDTVTLELEDGRELEFSKADIARLVKMFDV